MSKTSGVQALLGEIARMAQVVVAGTKPCEHCEWITGSPEKGLATVHVFVAHPAAAETIMRALDTQFTPGQTPRWAEAVAELLNREIAKENAKCESYARELSESTDLNAKEKGLLVSLADLIANRRRK